MSQGPLCPNLSQKVQAEVSQMANRNLSRVILLGGLSVNLNHLKTSSQIDNNNLFSKYSDKYMFTNCMHHPMHHPVYISLHRIYKHDDLC